MSKKQYTSNLTESEYNNLQISAKAEPQPLKTALGGALAEEEDGHHKPLLPN